MSILFCGGRTVLRSTLFSTLFAVLLVAQCSSLSNFSQQRVFASETNRSQSANTSYDFTPVTALMQQGIAQYNLNGAALQVYVGSQNAYEQPFGTYTVTTSVPIASTTKSLSAAVIMALVDAGKLALEDTAATFITSFETTDKKTITLRQLLTHTSGLPGEDVGCLNTVTTTLAACVDQIAQVALQYAPGTAFAYGGNSYQVAGRMAEVATGKKWAQLVAEQLTTPLGLTSVTYGNTQNPRIAGGASSNLADLGIVAQMLRDHGRYNNVQVLSSQAVADMTTDQVAGLPVLNSPAAPDSYGLGLWLQVDVTGNLTRFYGAGAFGTVFWIEPQTGIAAVFLVRDQYSRLRQFISQLQQAVDGVVVTGMSILAQPVYLPLLQRE